MPLQTSKSASPDLFDLQPTRNTPESFLGPNAALVNLDSLITKPAQPAPVSNPFLAGGMFDLYLRHVLCVASLGFMAQTLCYCRPWMHNIWL